MRFIQFKPVIEVKKLHSLVFEVPMYDLQVFIRALV